jgi:hypothetical protein
LSVLGTGWGLAAGLRWQQAVFPAGYDLFLTGRAGAKGSLRDGSETTVVAAPEPFDLAPAIAA